MGGQKVGDTAAHIKYDQCRLQKGIKIKSGANGYPRTALISNWPFDYVALRSCDVGHKTSEYQVLLLFSKYDEKKLGVARGRGYLRVVVTLRFLQDLYSMVNKRGRRGLAGQTRQVIGDLTTQLGFCCPLHTTIVSYKYSQTTAQREGFLSHTNFDNLLYYSVDLVYPQIYGNHPPPPNKI